MKKIFREIMPLTSNDCFSIFKREKTGFTFPLHYHDCIELNLIMNARGAQRIVGDHYGELTDIELVGVGANVAHGWFDHHCKNDQIREVTIQFHQDLLNINFLNRNQLSDIRTLLENFNRGILFSETVSRSVEARIVGLAGKTGFDSILELFSILDQLSLTSDYRLLTDVQNCCGQPYVNDRMSRVFAYMNANFHEHITLDQAADVASMATCSFSRFIKTHTGSSFTDALNDIRLAHVTRMLIETNLPVAEIAYKCGFNNMANFNRTFKSKKEITPKQFRISHTKGRLYV